jgi:hypothetical protein
MRFPSNDSLPGPAVDNAGMRQNVPPPRSTKIPEPGTAFPCSLATRTITGMTIMGRYLLLWLLGVPLPLLLLIWFFGGLS